MENERTKILGTEKIWKLLIKFSLPTITGLVVISLYNVVDRLFIGQSMGEIGIASISLVFPIFIAISGIGMLFGTGGGNVASIKLGEKNKEDAEKLLGNVFIIYTVLGVLIYILGLLFLDKFVYLLGASEETFLYTKQYTSIILMSVIFVFYSMGINNFIRAEGNPKIAMITMIIGAVINTILDPIFIFGLGMGIKGAAIATLIANIVSAFWNIYHFTFSKKSVLKLKKKNFKLDKSLLKETVEVGMSPFILQVSYSIIGIAYNKLLLKYGGETGIAVMGIINTIITLTILPINGLNSGSQPIMGYNYGAKNYKRVKETFQISVFAATFISVISFLIVELYPEIFIKMLSKGEKNLLDMGRIGIRLFFAANIVIGYQIVGANYFQVTGKPRYSIMLNLIRNVLLVIPFLFIFPIFMDIKGIWLSRPAADILAVIITYYFLRKELKKLKI